jgi:hypothetical protein
LPYLVLQAEPRLLDLDTKLVRASNTFRLLKDSVTRATRAFYSLFRDSVIELANNLESESKSFVYNCSYFTLLDRPSYSCLFILAIIANT